MERGGRLGWRSGAPRREQTTRKLLSPTRPHSYPLQSLCEMGCHEAEFAGFYSDDSQAVCWPPLSTWTHSYPPDPKGRVSKGLWLPQEKCGRRRRRPRPLNAFQLFTIDLILSVLGRRYVKKTEDVKSLDRWRNRHRVPCRAGNSVEPYSGS